ncbi:single-stranded-DNA-specific exonuclease RecJ [Spirulina sp. 06S082]|uniref:single-stranded-DNA-specific exonuclease RecJ n=1 Tax=Spirulina sp. 06S082 TaxID=3110248 RepID=UPI002B1F5FEF|nr:single-stranded-DNA-specific exonuclease RecJ [Spirulina sp. 06S082]MEA5468438.1 single-stranded-DNA-specific exonuclease RecJ [Spirulina sp. 06S082]
MNSLSPRWQLPPTPNVPAEFIAAIKPYCPSSEGKIAAQLLWQRNIRDLEKLPGFIDCDRYQPASPFEFGEEMKYAIKRLQKAREAGEKVTIWGDFDADGITSTSVLWDGLGQFFAQYLQLDYYIPNRLSESHGLNIPGIERLAATGTKLIVTCDTGSTNIEEIDRAAELGIDIIVTDHHTLPENRPNVVAIINPRYLEPTHSLYHLSGVAVAYKLVEALYEIFPEIPQKPLAELLDLVAIGLIADLVELKGDCRYLAQKGIKQLQKQLKNPTRPGVALLLKLCQRSGDRPTDISFGLGPRINAVSRIHGDANFCVELLTSRDRDRCQHLAEETELANSRRKELQKNVTNSVKKKLEQLDLSTTYVIVLEDSQWSAGVLGLVAGQIAQEYGRPTILLSTQNNDRETENKQQGIENEPQLSLARGSARSANEIDLYQLVHSQKHLLHRFGGHPYAAGLSLLVENLPLFTEAINQEVRLQINTTELTPIVNTDITVTVAELGKELFKELNLLEPCGMGNPVPKLLIENCLFTNIWHNNAKDNRGKKIQYIKTTFEIGDRSSSSKFPGVWWGHYKDELPANQPCDAIVELDYNTYKNRYEVRLIAVRICNKNQGDRNDFYAPNILLDWRGKILEAEKFNATILLEDCPTNWEKISGEFHKAVLETQKLALAYQSPDPLTSAEIWQKLAGIAKYLHRTAETTTHKKLQEKLEISSPTLLLGIAALEAIGFEIENNHISLQITAIKDPQPHPEAKIRHFLDALEEEQFQRQYFYKVPVDTLQNTLSFVARDRNTTNIE